MPSPKVGVGLFVFRPDGTFIIGKRKAELGLGSLALPGGHLEFGESFSTCAARELLEETGIHVREEDVAFLTAGNNVFEREGKHYVAIATGVFVGNNVEPEVTEPDKCESWEWITWRQLCQWAEEDIESGKDGEKRLFQPMVEWVTQREWGFNPLEVLKQKNGRTEKMSSL